MREVLFTGLCTRTVFMCWVEDNLRSWPLHTLYAVQVTRKYLRLSYILGKYLSVLTK